MLGLISQMALPAQAVAGEWAPVGSRGFTPFGVSQNIVRIHDGVPYAAFHGSATNRKVSVSKFNGTSWEAVGSPQFAAGRAQQLDFEFNGSVPYVSYTDWSLSFKLVVKKFNGTSWEDVGPHGMTPSSGYNSSLLFVDGTPYIAYVDGGLAGKITVMTFNGTSWENVGSPGFSDNGVGGTVSLVFADEELHVAYIDGAAEDRITVKRFDGSDWVPVGEESFSPAVNSYVDLAFIGDTPYVLSRIDDEASRPVVMRFDGSDWEEVGEETLPNSKYSVPGELVAAGGDLYLIYGGYDETEETFGGFIMKLVGDEWEQVGTGSIAEDYANSFYIAGVSDELYAGFDDASSSGFGTVFKFTPSESEPEPEPEQSPAPSSGKKKSSKKAKVPVCSSLPPQGTPDLFQINRTGSDAVLYFTPVQGNTNGYHVVFGFTEGDERFGGITMPVTQESNHGVQSIKVEYLDPNASYWFRVLPANGCAVGTWSNWLKAEKTASKTGFFYRYN